MTRLSKSDFHESCDSSSDPALAIAIQTWLVSKIAEITGMEPQKIETWEPFTTFGLVSKDVVMLSGELEDLLGRKVDLVTPGAIKPRMKPYMMQDVVYVA